VIDNLIVSLDRRLPTTPHPAHPEEEPVRGLRTFSQKSVSEAFSLSRSNPTRTHTHTHSPASHKVGEAFANPLWKRTESLFLTVYALYLF
jgi:hypothetical protein